MIVGKDHLATSGFGSFWIWSDRETTYKPRGRDYRLSARSEPCETCGAKPGEACTRPSLIGRMPRLLPHVGRARPMHSVHALSNGYNDTHAPKVRIYGDR